MTNDAGSQGIIGPRTEGFQVHNVKFYRFDNGGKSALGSCSHCFSPPSTDSGARTVSYSGIWFDPLTVPQKIKYGDPWRDIFFDIDGSLTGLGPGSWATPFWKHNLQPECQNRTEYDGIICNSSVQVRRIVFYQYTPDLLTMMDLKVLKIDDYIISGMSADEKAAYYANLDNYAVIPFRPK